MSMFHPDAIGRRYRSHHRSASDDAWVLAGAHLVLSGKFVLASRNLDNVLREVMFLQVPRAVGLMKVMFLSGASEIVFVVPSMLKDVLTSVLVTPCARLQRAAVAPYGARSPDRSPTPRLAPNGGPGEFAGALLVIRIFAMSGSFLWPTQGKPLAAAVAPLPGRLGALSESPRDKAVCCSYRTPKF